MSIAKKLEEFEEKLKKMSLNELYQYRKMLYNNIIRENLAGESTYETIHPIMIRGAVDREIMSRLVLKKKKEREE